MGAGSGLLGTGSRRNGTFVFSDLAPYWWSDWPRRSTPRTNWSTPRPKRIWSSLGSVVKAASRACSPLASSPECRYLSTSGGLAAPSLAVINREMATVIQRMEDSSRPLQKKDDREPTSTTSIPKPGDGGDLLLVPSGSPRVLP